MDRYNKYLVLKVADIEKHLSEDKQLKLDALITNIRIGRLNDGKQDQQYVVVAADWPMYETVWGMIEAYVDGKPDELSALRTRIAELEAELAACREDAARYRWLRDVGGSTWNPLAKRYMDSCALPSDVDAAIDAARSEK